MARVAAPERQLPDEWDVLAAEYIDIKRQIAELQRKEKQLKPKIVKYLQENGEEDEKGHQTVEFDDEVGGYRGIQRQRAVSVKLDEDAAERVLKQYDLWERCAPPTPVIDEQEVYEALKEGLLLEQHMAEMFPPSETFRVVLVR